MGGGEFDQILANDFWGEPLAMLPGLGLDA